MRGVNKQRPAIDLKYLLTVLCDSCKKHGKQGGEYYTNNFFSVKAEIAKF
jgi:hypothetical protein